MDAREIVLYGNDPHSLSNRTIRTENPSSTSQHLFKCCGESARPSGPQPDLFTQTPFRKWFPARPLFVRFCRALFGCIPTHLGRLCSSYPPPLEVFTTMWGRLRPGGWSGALSAIVCESQFLTRINLCTGKYWILVRFCVCASACSFFPHVRALIFNPLLRDWMFA